ncbi:DUF488 domain-containing protein [Desulfatitalea tepidiphila]|uniref:DUF488 domain-containing protein n=1 Tax=Desulfatitalea tepidiphila TaxID=1185843 RepID=UPI0006B52893|nr:DUF488 family protein [Desulfatitalea tepidiphila]
MDIYVKRVYDRAASEDGFRILVDRLWPRGLSKTTAKIDLWLKSLAPSNDLRKWYQHDSEKWPEFKQRYFAELDSNEDSVNEIIGHLKKGRVCLLYSSKESQYNNAVALKDYLNNLVKQWRGAQIRYS